MKKTMLLSAVIATLLLTACGGNETKISSDRAKEIALENAGVNAENVTFAKVEKDRDDGKTLYEVEFYTNEGTEYDYEIDAETGDIISYDSEIESRKRETAKIQKAEETLMPNEGAVDEEASEVTADRAKEIALEKVPGATLENIVAFKPDREDGRNVYEGKIIYNNTEYEFEIDAQTGNVNEWESESIYD